MVAQAKLITADEFLAIAQRPEYATKRIELIGGVITEMPPSRQINAVLAAWIIHLLFAYVRQNDLGYVTGPDGGYRVSPHDVFQPDAAFISKARAAGLTGVEFPVAPDLAVEIVSPSETSRKVLDKARAYLQAGTQFVWAVYPDDKVVDVYCLLDDGGLKVQTIGIDGELDGGRVLPGFTVKVSEVFAGLGV